MRSFMMRTSVLALAALCGCSFYVNTELEALTPSEGEGEGEDEEGEEGEGEGEGEEDDDDPACEADERLLVVRDDSTTSGADALQIYTLANGAFARRFPEGNNGNVNVENDDSNAYSISDVAIGTDNRLYLVGSSSLYQFNRSTLTQETITGRQQLILESFGSANQVEVVNGRILTFGDNIRSLNEGADAGAIAAEFHTGDDYLGTTTFSIGTTKYVAASAHYGFVVIGAEGDNPPGVVGFHDGEFDDGRINSFGSGHPPKGIAFDTLTRKLLLGGNGRVIVIGDDFVLPETDEGDFLVANSTSDVAAIAARGGFAFVLLRRGTDNLIKLDLSQSPPRAVGIATVQTDSFGRGLAIGCRRVFAIGPDRVVAVRRDTMAAAGNLALRGVERVRVVKKQDLGLAGEGVLQASG